MNTPINEAPRTMVDFLAQVSASLRGSDPAMIQDALFDSEEYLRAAIADNAALSESEVMALVLEEYGTPQEVADNYRTTDATVQAAIKPTFAAPVSQKGFFSRIFGVFVDPYAYGSLFYMLLSLWTGIFYFTYVTVGASLSLSMIILIIGLPLLILFLGSVRVLSLVEGRIVETLLGVRMPRRPMMPLQRDGNGWIERIKNFFTDPRTWSTILYLLLMLPLGTAYFTIAITGLALGLACLLSPLAALFGEISVDGVSTNISHIQILGTEYHTAGWVMVPLVFLFGLAVLLALMHFARLVGRFHGSLAKNLLVKL